MELMDKMMERMVKNMTIEEKEDMMLKMMPMMMERIDIERLMPEMMTAGGSLITVTGIVTFFSKALNDEELKEMVSEMMDSFPAMPAMAEKMQPMMSMMMSAMPDMMFGMMDFMGEKMMPMMMPMMLEMMPVMMHDKMPEIMERNKTMREMMPVMMMEVMPNCVVSMAHLIEEEKRGEFISDLNSAIDQVT